MTPLDLPAVILAAGAGTRYGGGKARAPLAGRPLAAHVLAAARAAGIGRLVLVLGRDAPAVRGALLADDSSALAGVLVAVNPAPERGIASSLRLGLSAAADAGRTGVLVLLADQPLVRPDVIRALADARPAASPAALAIAPEYERDGAPNPVLVLPAGIAAAATLEGDHGLGRLLRASPDRVVRVPVPGSNPDVDTPADLAALEGSPAGQERAMTTRGPARGGSHP